MNKLADRSNLHEYRTIAMHRLAALAAAPDYHRVLFENERVRVLDTRPPAGEQTPVHAPRIARSALCRELERLHPPMPMRTCSPTAAAVRHRLLGRGFGSMPAPAFG